MNTIRGFAIIMAFYALGEALSTLMAHFVPGSVIGMVLLFAALCLGWVKAESIRAVAQFLTGNMVLLFIPMFLGIIDLWGIVKVSWIEWLAVVVLSTVAVMAGVGYSVELVDGWRSRSGGKKSGDH